MIKNLMDIIKSKLPKFPRVPKVNPEKFNDQLAFIISWKCLKSNSSNFTTHKLIDTKDKLVYKSTKLLKFFGWPFIVVGVALLVAYFAALIERRILLVVGPLFIIAGVMVIYQSIIPIGFDSEKRLFYSGWRNKHCVTFSQIHAIQVLTKIGSVSSGSDSFRDHYFYAYELNLVLHDSSRRYVMTYICLEQVLEDAEKIANCIRVPVWNGTSYKISENLPY